MFEQATSTKSPAARMAWLAWPAPDALVDPEMSPSRTITVLLITDNPCSAREIEELLAAPGPGHILTSWMRPAPAAAGRWPAADVSLALLEIGDPPTPAFGALNTLRTAHWGLPVLVLAEDDAVALRALRRGSYAALPRSTDGRTLRRLLISATEWRNAHQDELVALLNRFALPAVLVNETGAACLANAAARPALRGDRRPEPFGWGHPRVASQVRAAVERVKSTGVPTALALSQGSGLGSLPAVIAQVGNPRLGRRPVVYLLLFGEAVYRGPQRSALLRAMWDLSPAELRLTGELMQGRTVTEAAARLDIAVSTARTQLKRVLAKVGVRRQVELVRAFLVGPAGMLGDKD